MLNICLPNKQTSKMGESFHNLIKNNKSIKSLKLLYSREQMRNLEFSLVFNYDYLRLNSCIKVLDLSGCLLNRDGFKSLVRGLSLNKIKDLSDNINKVHTLILKRTIDHPDYLGYLGDIIKENTNIDKLDISDSYFGNKFMMTALCELLKNNLKW